MNIHSATFELEWEEHNDIKVEFEWTSGSKHTEFVWLSTYLIVMFLARVMDDSRDSSSIKYWGMSENVFPKVGGD